MSARQQAIQKMKAASDSQLERFVRSQGHDVAVNWLTRGTVERKIREKLDEYTDKQIKSFLTKI